MIFGLSQVDVAIYETHHGGEYDSTNVLLNPKVTGITSIGLDHLAQLGPTIENVAWHKAGIFKYGAAAYTVPQSPSVLQVLETRAMERGVRLETVKNQALHGDRPPEMETNETLAIAISNAYLKSRGQAPLSKEDVLGALGNFTWPGRFNVIRRGSSTWFVDGAHNMLSIDCSARWFSSASIKSEYAMDSAG